MIGGKNPPPPKKKKKAHTFSSPASLYPFPVLVQPQFHFLTMKCIYTYVYAHQNYLQGATLIHVDLFPVSNVYVCVSLSRNPDLIFSAIKAKGSCQAPDCHLTAHFSLSTKRLELRSGIEEQAQEKIVHMGSCG